MRILLALLLAACAPSQPRPLPPAPVSEVRDTVFLLLRPVRAYPTALHAATWTMVGQCLGHAPRQMAVTWFVADSIVGDPSGRMPYGALYRRGPSRPAVVVISRPFWFNVTVISHELVHLRGNAPEGSPALTECTLYTGLDLPRRRVRLAEIHAIRARAYVLGGS